MTEPRAWIVYTHDDQATSLPDAPPCKCGATLTDLIPVSGITTLDDEYVPWSGTCHRCGACGDLSAPRVTLHRKPRPRGPRRNPR